MNPPELDETNRVILTAYENGVYSNGGELQRRASMELALHVSSVYEGILVSSNTSGLVASLLAANVRNKHVVISNFTFSATMHAVILAGGIPILCDVTENSLEMDSKKLHLILSNPRYDVAAVMPTRVFGYINDQSDLIQKCQDFKIPIIIDAAAAFPPFSQCWNFKNNANAEVFSLHASKVFGIGEGGVIVGSTEFIEKIRKTTNFGVTSGSNEIFEDGLNAKADEFMAARALVRIKDYGSDVLKRQEFVNSYKTFFTSYKSIRILEDDKNTVYSYFPIIFHSENDLLRAKKLLDPFLVTRRYYYPTMKSGYKGNAVFLSEENLKVSESVAKRILCLPVYVSFTPEIKEFIFNVLSKALNGLK